MPRDLLTRPMGMPIRIAHHTSLRIYKLAGWINSELDHALSVKGLKTRDYSVLSVIQYQGPRSQQEIAQKLRIDKATMVAIVDTLERLGLVERQRNQADRRNYSLTITQAGERTVEETELLVTEIEEAMFAPLTTVQREALQTSISRLFRAS